MSELRGASSAHPLFAGPGELRSILRGIEWASTPLGSVEGWRCALRGAVRLCLDALVPTMVFAGPDLRVIYNEACPPILGTNKHPGALGHPAHEVWPEHWSRIAPEIELVMSRGEAVHREDERFLILREAREPEAFLTYAATPIREDDGSIVGVMAMLNESTDRIRAALRREEFLSFALSAAHMGAWHLDLLDHRMERSAGYDALFGYEQPPETWTLETFLEHVLPEDRPEVERQVRKSIEGKTALSFECRIRRRDGTRRWIWAAGRQLDHPERGRRHLAGVLRDITPRKRSEQALRQSEERFRALVTTTSYLVYRMNPDWTEMRGFCGHDAIDAAGKPRADWLAKYVHPDDHARVRVAVRAAIQARATFELEHRILHPDGGSRWVFSRAVPILGADGELIEWFGAATDVTARKRAELAVEAANSQLLEADRRKDEFLAMLSHELRNPLAPIENSLHILDHVMPAEGRARRAKEVLDRQVNQLSHLINDLLDVTRISHGKIQLQRRRVELNDLVQRTLEDQRDSFERSQLELRFEPAATEVFVNADWNRIAQVVANLLQNAAKFTPPAGKVTVQVAAEAGPGQAVIRVIDNGVGMAPETIERLFEPFRQADTTLERSKGGLGLGLALVKGLIAQHGGTVAATSCGLGAGSEFTVRLPLDLGTEVVNEPPRVAAPKAHRRVLVIEDNIDAAATLREVLELDGHEVVVAHDGAHGLEQAHVFHPELVLCDIGLPGMDGYAVARAFRSDEELKNTHLVALTGYALPKDLQRALDAGFEHHLAKPASLDRLIAVFDSVASH